MDEVFADGVGEITVINGVARLTLITLETPPGARESGEAKPVAVKTRKLVMPLPGLANMVQQAQGLLARIEQASGSAPAASVPSRQAPSANAAVPVAPAVKTPSTGTAPRSPNF